MFTIETMFRLIEAYLRLRGVRRRSMPTPAGTISYLEHGSKKRPTVVLVHGLGSSSLVYGKVITRLGRRFHLLLPDLPGWGASAPPAGKDHATIQDLVQGLTAFLEGRAKGPVVLVGQSLGGWVSAKAAAARSDLVSTLVLCNSAGVLYPDVAELQRKLDLRTKEEVESFWRDMYHKVPLFYRFFKGDYVARLHEPRVLNFFQSVQDESEFVNADLARIRMPVVILWGMEDRFIPSHTVDVLMKGLSDVTVHWIPRCGHIPALERPGEFVRILAASLAPPDVPDQSGPRPAGAP